MYEGIALTIRGFGHIKNNIARQDYAAAYTDSEGGWAMAVVSDGHGGENYYRSHIGSRLAAESAVRSIKGCLQDPDEKKIFLDGLQNDRDKTLKRLEKSIYTNWITMVEKFDSDPAAFDWSGFTDTIKPLTESDGAEDANLIPVQEGIDPEWEAAWREKYNIAEECDSERRERLYGCTLLAAVISPEFCFSVQVGDGCCVLICRDDGAAELMFPIDETIPANITHSMCKDPLEHFERRALTPCESGQTAALLLSTDGLYNSCSGQEDFLRLNRRILSHMNPANGLENREAFLKWLRFHLSERSRMSTADDISIALVFAPDIDFENIMPKSSVSPA